MNYLNVEVNQIMAMCHICKTVRRKAKGESWEKLMCKDCYRITDHFSWDARWQLSEYLHDRHSLYQGIIPQYTMITQKRQGDILFELVESKDTNFLQLNEDGIVAYGEISNHKHFLKSNAQLYVRPQTQRGRNEEDLRIGYIMTDEETSVSHDEHATINLPKGIYKVSQQREFVQERADLSRYKPPQVKRVQD